MNDLDLAYLITLLSNKYNLEETIIYEIIQLYRGECENNEQNYK